MSRIPNGFHTLTPHLNVHGADEAIVFYFKAFNATLIGDPMRSPDGKAVMHAQMRIGDSMLMLNDEFPDWGCLGPLALKGTPVTLHLYVDDVDALWQQAVAAGCTVAMPLENAFWGDRYGQLIDPYGHRWSLASKIERPQ
jgi:PhnB protein